MKDIYDIELHLKHNKITKTELAELSGFTTSQLRRMFKGNVTIKELAKLKSALNLQ